MDNAWLAAWILLKVAALAQRSVCTVALLAVFRKKNERPALEE